MRLVHDQICWRKDQILFKILDLYVFEWLETEIWTIVLPTV